MTSLQLDTRWSAPMTANLPFLAVFFSAVVAPVLFGVGVFIRCALDR